MKLPVTPSTATLTKTQKNKTKNKKKPVEQKTTKQSVSPAKNTSIPAPSSSQVTGFACSLKYIIIWWNYILVYTVRLWVFCQNFQAQFVTLVARFQGEKKLICASRIFLCQIHCIKLFLLNFLFNFWWLFFTRLSD